MKHFWKKVNRGLLLGGVLLLGLVIMIVLRQVRFEKEVPEIKETAENFARELAQLNLTPERVSVGGKLSQEQLDKKLQELNAWGTAYWHHEKNNRQEDVLPFTDLEEAFTTYWNRERIFLLESIDLSVGEHDIEVTQSGPDYAKVTLLSDTVSARVWAYEESGFAIYMGNIRNNYIDTEVILPGDKVEIDPGIGDSDTEEKVLTAYDCFYMVSMSIELKRVDGEWRVVSFYGNAHSTHVNAVNEKGGANP